MNTNIINSIFFPRKSSDLKDDKDFLVNVSDKDAVGVRFFLKDKRINLTLTPYPIFYYLIEQFLLSDEKIFSQKNLF